MQPAPPYSPSIFSDTGMKWLSAVVCGLTTVTAVGLLVMDVEPGVLETYALGVPCICLVFPAVGVWCLAVAVLAVWDVSRGLRVRWWKRWGVFSAVTVVGTFFLLRAHVPRAAVFWLSVAEFDRAVEAGPPVMGRYDGGLPGGSFGGYQVDRHGTYRNGEVFFRTATGPDGISPDQMSYGFVYRPNGVGTPFGNARYRLGHLFGDWYWFAVSDDS